MIRAFAVLFQDLLTQLSEDEKWRDIASIKKAIAIGHAILSDEIIPEKLIKLAIITVEGEKLDKEDELITLLLAILYSELEESIPESLKCFERLSQMVDEPSRKSIVCFLAVVRVTELNDFNNLMEDGLTILEHYKEDALSVLWKMSNKVDVKLHTKTFLAFINKCRETSGPRIGLFEGWFYSEVCDYSRSLECYLLAKGQLEKEMAADELADLWNSITICYMSLPTPDPGNALAAINKALQYDFLLDEFQNEIIYLTTRARIYLMLDEQKDQNQEKAIADLNRVLTYDANHEIALNLLRKIDVGQVNL